MVMIKPALSYLDIIRRVADTVRVPVAAYQVSGEFAMLEAAAANGWVDRDKAIMETLTSIRRAGASVILTYWAAAPSAGGRCAANRRPRRRIIVTIRSPALSLVVRHFPSWEGMPKHPPRAFFFAHTPR